MKIYEMILGFVVTPFLFLVMVLNLHVICVFSGIGICLGYIMVVNIV